MPIPRWRCRAVGTHLHVFAKEARALVMQFRAARLRQRARAALIGRARARREADRLRAEYGGKASAPAPEPPPPTAGQDEARLQHALRQRREADEVRAREVEELRKEEERVSAALEEAKVVRTECRSGFLTRLPW